MWPLESLLNGWKETDEVTELLWSIGRRKKEEKPVTSSCLNVSVGVGVFVCVCVCVCVVLGIELTASHLLG
jgi:hypothetical protein